MGLIGYALAGAAQEAGRAGEIVGLKSMEDLIQRDRDARLHENAKELETMREGGAMQRLQISESGAMERLGVSEKGAAERLATSEAGATTRQKQGFTHAEELQRLRNTFEAEQKALDRTLTREEIAARKEIAGANNATALQVAKIGGTIQQDKDGNILFFNKQGEATQIKDPVTGEPMKGLKDLTPAAKQYADVIKTQMVGLDKEEVAALDQASKDAIVARRAQLNKDLLNVLTGGISEAGKSAPAAGKTGFDPDTGKVFKNGQEVGTAKSVEEARKLISQPGAAAAAAPIVEGRPLYNTPQLELKRLAGRPKGVSPAQASEAQQELDRRAGESRMSAG